MAQEDNSLSRKKQVALLEKGAAAMSALGH
jgi:hypothetical protein